MMQDPLSTVGDGHLSGPIEEIHQLALGQSRDLGFLRTSSGCWTAWTSWSSRCTSTPAAPNRCATPAESTALGQSPIEFLKSLRLARAAQLLTHTDLPVKSVAARVGYSSRSSFTRAFVAHHRAGPTAFRIAAAHPEPRPPIRGTYMPMPGAEVA